jgi:hypothetical protein
MITHTLKNKYFLIICQIILLYTLLKCGEGIQINAYPHDIYIGISNFIEMNIKTSIAIFAIVITAFGIIAATSIIGSEDAFANKGHHHGKWCNPHGCKGSKGFYTERGHHHCWRGSEGCYSKHHH